MLLQMLVGEDQRIVFLSQGCEKEKNSELDPMETFVCSDRDGSGSFDVRNPVVSYA